MGFVGWFILGLGSFILLSGFPAGIVPMAIGALILCWRYYGRNRHAPSASASSLGFKAGQLAGSTIRDAKTVADDAVKTIGLDRLATDTRRAADGFWAGLRSEEPPHRISAPAAPQTQESGSHSPVSIQPGREVDYGKLLQIVFDVVLIAASITGIAILGEATSRQSPSQGDAAILALFIAKLADPVIFAIVAIGCCFATRWSHACAIWLIGCVVSLTFLMGFHHPAWALGPGIPATGMQVLLCFSIRRWILSARKKKNAQHLLSPMRDDLSSPATTSPKIGAN